MSQTVVFVLNEREPRKKEAAEKAEHLLAERTYQTARVAPSAGLVEHIIKLEPSVVVLDFVLGDVATGLDVLERLRASLGKDAPQCIFLTDEPSLDVVVSAFRLGARHYLRLHQPNVLTMLVDEITEILRSQAPTDAEESSPAPETSDRMVALSEEAQRVKTEIMHARLEAGRIALFFGPRGSGKSFSASLRFPTFVQHEVMLSLYDQDLERLLKPGAGTAELETVLSQYHLIISELDDDDGELLELICKRAEMNQSNSPALSLCCSNEEILRRWEKLPFVDVIRLPRLVPDRLQDIPLLVQQFTVEWARASGQKPPRSTTELSAWCGEQEWPGHVRQLRTVIFQALIEGGRQTERAELERVYSYSLERFQNPDRTAALPVPEPLALAREFALNRYRLRPTALSFGLPVPLARRMLLSNHLRGTE